MAKTVHPSYFISMAMKLPLETIQKVQTMLNAVPFMKALSQDDVNELAYSLNQRHFMRGETIIRQGEPGKLFYLCFKGTVGVYRERLFGRKKIAALGPGDFFGEISLVDNVPRTATVMGEEDGIMYTLARDAFEAILLKNPGVSEVIRKTAAERKQAGASATA